MKANSKFAVEEESEYTTTEFEFYLFAGDKEIYASVLRDEGIEGTEWHFASAEDALAAGKKMAAEEYTSIDDAAAPAYPWPRPDATKILIQGGVTTWENYSMNEPLAIDFDEVYTVYHEITAA